MNIGPLEIAIVVVIVLLLFGAKKLPEMGKGLGRGMREFKDGIVGDHSDEEKETPEVIASTIPPPPPVERRETETADRERS
jgi:sec-independent protein translocase protein TatA